MEEEVVPWKKHFGYYGSLIVFVFIIIIFLWALLKEEDYWPLEAGDVAITEPEPKNTALLGEVYNDVAARIHPVVVYLLGDGKAVKEEEISFAGSQNGKNIGSKELKNDERVIGAGILVDNSGIILTNAHFLQTEFNGRVSVYRGHDRFGRERYVTYPANILEKRPEINLALLQIISKGWVFPVAKLGNSDLVQRGDLVATLGSPLGIRGTFDLAIVRNHQVDLKIEEQEFTGIILTSSPAIPRNSGAPLFNMKGEVIGIFTSIHPDPSSTFQTGVAIPIKSSYPLLQKYGVLSEKVSGVRGAWMGVYVRDVDAADVDQLNLPSDAGVVVVSVQKWGPGSRAGIKPGDVILKFGYRRISGYVHLQQLISSQKPGAQVLLKVLRGEKNLSLSVILGALPQELPEKPATKTVKEISWLGGTLISQISQEACREWGIPEDTKGVLISEPRGILKDQGFLEGDVIQTINDLSILDLEGFLEAKKNIDTTRGFKLGYYRKGSQVTIDINLTPENTDKDKDSE